MVKRRREEIDSDGATETENMTSYKTVFIDTNLDTHLAVIVSDSDTISDLKKKLVFEHLRCFPEMSELKISSVKVKRKRHYYHLPDTMLVRGVFEGSKKEWFLSVDASRFQCLENDQGLLCIAYPQIETENLLPCDSFNAMDKQKVFDTSESYPASGNLASSSIVKHKEVAKVIGEFKSVKRAGNSQELSPRSGPVAKKRKIKHKEDRVNHPVTGTSASNHGIDNGSKFKIVGNDTTLTNSNEGEQENINMKLVDVSAEPLINQRSDPSKVSKLGMKKSRKGGASAEILGVQDELCGDRNNDALGETSHSGTLTNKVKILGSKESSGASTEFNHRDSLKIAIPENSTAGKPIKATLAEETLGDQSVRTDTTHKKRTKKIKKGKDSSTCHDEVACMVLGSNDKFVGTRGLEQKEGVEMKIFDKLTDVNSTIHATQSRLKETSLVKDHASNKECPALVSKGICEMNLVGQPILESNVSGDNELGIDVANTTGEQELIPNCDFEMPMSEKLSDPSTRGPVPSYQLGELQGAAENSFGRKRSRAKKSTSHQELDMKNIVGASQNAYASDQDIVRNDGSSDATTKVGSMPKTNVDYINEIGIEGKLSVTQGAETSPLLDNNEPTGDTKEQVLSAKRALDDKENIESGNASSMKRKKTSRRKSAEKIPVKLNGEDDSTVNCPSLAEGIGSTTDPVTGQSKKGEISFDAEVLQISLNTEVKGSPQVQSAACRSSDTSKAEMNIKEVETISTAPSDVKVAEGHGTSGRRKNKKTKMEVSTHINDVSCAPSATHDTSVNHFVEGSNQDKNALPASKRKGASEQVSKSTYAVGSQHQVEKATCIEPELLPVEEKENEAEHLRLNQTDKNQETLSISEKRLKAKTKKSQSSKKSKSILSIQDQEGSHKDLKASNDNLEDVNPLPEPMEMDESGKNIHVDQYGGNKLENQRNSGIHSDFESSREDIRNADSFPVPSHALTKGALEEMHEPDVNTDKSDAINFKQYFVPGQQGEVASKKPMKPNRDAKASRKSKGGMTSRGFLEDISKSRIEVALPSQGDKTLEEAGKLATYDAPAYKKKNEESMDESRSSSSSKGPGKFLEDNRRQTGSEIQSSSTRNTKIRTANIEDFTQPKKGLLPNPGPKFGDSRSRRSDSKEGGDSDSTTDTRSDSSSSGSSVEGSEISQASTPEGANVAKNNAAAAGKHKLKSNFFLGEALTMEMILRNSSRFKKAKVSAAQSQDEESQPVDVVPDNLADTRNE
ncbi:hypothetical protein H5410_026349 [Solanum commersonii]|uniref:Uncharacterized protein n=1 Tax=Solanum commersonii TaxID=4109 RepID=A0A9J5YWA6_SOLCO|nr:hypothetical protein H5410_026349 [Solanum commersonii]